MAKIIKKITALISYLLLFIILLPVMLWGILQIPYIQNIAVSNLTDWLSHKTKAEINFSKVKIGGLNKVFFNELLILDPHRDTLIYAEKVVAAMPGLYKILSKQDIDKAFLRKLKFENSCFNLTIDSAGITNLQFLIDFLQADKDTISGEKKPFRLKDIQIIDSRFTLRNKNKGKIVRGIDFSDLQLNDFNLHVKDLLVLGNTVRLTIESMTFREQTGFKVDELNAEMDISPAHLFFDKVSILTPLSSIKAERVHMSFDKFKDFGINTLFKRIIFNLSFFDSRINLSDVGYFTDFFWNDNQNLILTGDFDGSLSNFRGKKIFIKWGESSCIKGDFDMNGLPKIQETFLVFNLHELSTDTKEISALQLPGNRTISLPENFKKLSNIRYRGNFTGFFNDFVAHGRLETDLGEIYTDIMFVPDTMNEMTFSGKIKTKEFLVGRFIGKEELFRDISINAEIEGFYSKKKPFLVDINGTVDKFTVNNYAYSNIDINASVTNNRFNGQLNIQDPNLNMEFAGLVDLSQNPWIYDFRANIIDADIYALKISDSDPNYHASFLVQAKASGKSFDDLNGEINLVNSLFSKTNKQIQVYDLNLYARNNEEINEIILRSDILDMDISGKFHLLKLKDEFMHYLSCYMPALIKKVYSPTDESTLTQVNLSAKFKETQPFFDFFFPEYMVGKSTVAKGIFIPGNKNLLILDIIAPELKFKQNLWHGLVINISSDDSTLTLDAGSSIFNYLQRIDLENFTLRTTTKNNLVEFSTRWLNWDSAVYQGKLTGNILFAGGDSANSCCINLTPSSITISDSIWNISAFKIAIDTSGCKVENAKIFHDRESIQVQGKLSDIKGDSLHITFTDFNLGYINYFTRKKNYKFEGLLNGSGHMTGLKKNPLFLSSFTIDSLYINNEELGHCTLQSAWNNSRQALSIDASAERGKLTVLHFVGDYYPSLNGKMDFLISLNKLKTDIFNPFLVGIFSDIKGLVSGNLQLTGVNGKPSLEGKLIFQKNAFTINYLKTRYNFTSDVEVVNNNFILDNIDVFDQEGNTAIVNGMIRTESLKEINLNININAKKFLCLNTKETDNSLFYGTAYASGNVRIVGKPSTLRFDIDAKSDMDTRFFIPLTENMSVSVFDYVTFIQNDTSEAIHPDKQPEHKVKLTGMQMNFNLNITPDAEVQIIFDSKMGDIIKARGSGVMKMSINTLGSFDLKGEYIIEKGDYLFTLQNVINKKFTIEPNSKIRWSGDPLNAQVDITAVYRTKASLKELFPNDPNIEGRTTVDCQIFLSGPLLKPEIKYDLYLPFAEDRLRERVKSKISSEEMLTKQILGLLVLNSFFTESNDPTGGENVSSGSVNYAGNASELLSNQLSNWLSQISNEFDIGVNYRPGTKIDSREVELALSTQILNDRLSLNGSLDMKSNVTAENSSKLLGDVDLDYKLNKSGKIRLRAFNRSNSDKLMYNSDYTQGIGVFFMEEFNTISELFNRYWAFLTGKSKKKNPPKVDAATK